MQREVQELRPDRTPLGSGLMAQVGDSMRIASTLEKLGQVSVQPGPLVAVLHASPEDPEAVTAAIEGSPALAARLLCVTNSAGIGLSRQIDCVRRAVIHLGASRARLIAMAFGLRMIGEGCGLDAEVAHTLWVSALRKAAAARLMAQVLDPRHADRAYSAALLQDVGLPMLMSVDPGFYERDLVPGPETGSWSDQERSRFGLDHGQVGKRLLEGWNAAARTADLVVDHHRPPGDGEGALERVPLFMAALMPHLAEPTTPAEQEWIVALHAQFLAHAYASPDAFFTAAARAAAPLHGGASPPPRL